MNTAVMFSSKTDDWATPQQFFDDLNREFGFTLDPCADDRNHILEPDAVAVLDAYIKIGESNIIPNWR